MHYIKFTRGQAMAVFKHCARENANYGNENINPSRIDQNYNLGPSGNQWGLMEDRLKQLTYRQQKNNVVLCGWIVTAPGNLPEEKKRDFFKLMYDFMAKKYGAQNIVSAWVHMDEAGPGHMHFLFVPGTKDLKLSASQTTNRSVLQHIHDDAQKVIDKHLGHEYLLRADDPKERAKGSVPVEKLKQALNELETQNDIASLENIYLEDQKDSLTRIVGSMTEQRKALGQEIAAKKQELEQYSQKAIEAHRMAQELPELRQRVNALQKHKQALESDIEANKQELEQYSKKAIEAHRMAQELPELRQRVNVLQKHKQALESDIEGTRDILERFKENIGNIALHGELAYRELSSAIFDGNITNEYMEQLQHEINDGNQAADLIEYIDEYDLDR